VGTTVVKLIASVMSNNKRMQTRWSVAIVIRCSCMLAVCPSFRLPVCCLVLFSRTTAVNTRKARGRRENISFNRHPHLR